MGTETSAGEQVPVLGPLAEPGEAFSLRPEAKKPARKAAVPVARLARPTAAPRLRVESAAAPEQELLTRESYYGLGASLAFHLLLLLVMAVWYFVPRRDDVRRFDSSLAAGSPFGDELGTELRGAQGLDAPIAMPETPAAPSEKTITALPTADLGLDAILNKPSGPTAGGGSGGLTGAGAGSGDGFGVARFGEGGENINGVRVKVGDPQFTLLWDAKVDLDLHVLEPGGSEIFWEEPIGTKGGELDVDDIDGFGPENVNYSGGRGKGPSGAYRWFVHYYGARDGISLPTRWKVRVKHDGVVNVIHGKFQRIGERSKVLELKLDRPGDDEGAAKVSKP